MFGSNKYKQQCFNLEQENQRLRDKVAELEKSVHEAEHGKDDLLREAKGGAENLKQLIKDQIIDPADQVYRGLYHQEQGGPKQGDLPDIR